jgi:hypothetical protein
MLFLFLTRRKRKLKARLRDTYPNEKGNDLWPKHSVGPVDPPSLPPLKQHNMLNVGWNHENSFAMPSNRPPQTPRTRRFGGPLALNPLTPLPPIAIKFQTARKSLAERFRFSNISSQSPRSLAQQRGPSIHTEPSPALPPGYNRLSSLTRDDSSRRATS